jgi:hypothetical protein
MCVIVHSPKGTEIDKNTMEKLWKRNNDGGGFMLSKDNRLIVKKGYFNFDAFLKDFTVYNCSDIEKAIHFRIKTKGKVDIVNCHPFKIHENLAVMHNGILSGFGNESFSDTYCFVDEILRKMPKKILSYDGILKLINDKCGFYSKLLFMGNNGNTFKTNEKQWIEIGGIYYSNRNGIYDYSKFNHTAIGDRGGFNNNHKNSHECRYCKRILLWRDEEINGVCRICEKKHNGNYYDFYGY